MNDRRDEGCSSCPLFDECAGRTVSHLERRINPDLVRYLRDKRGASKSQVALTNVDNQNKRDLLKESSRNYACPVCRGNHTIKGPPTTFSLEEQFYKAEEEGRLDEERIRLGDHARAVDLWLELRELEDRIRRIDPRWRIRTPTDSREGIKREVDSHKLTRKSSSRYVNIFGTKFVKRKR